jgi:RNA-directed DNA polymerase
LVWEAVNGLTACLFCAFPSRALRPVCTLAVETHPRQVLVKQFTAIQYARFADDLVILVDAHKRHDWLVTAVTKRLREELGKLRVEVSEEKSRIVDLRKGESFSFLGFEFRLVRSLKGRWRPQYTPKVRWKRNSATFDAG